ncbi:MAG: YchJ family metal-binding protein [Myxococcota bacterium]
MTGSRCRCHSRRQARRCCEPLHQGKPAPTAEALMRSRYAAYALGLVDYVVATTDPDGPQWHADVDAWRADVARFCRDTRFVDLRIDDAPPPDGDVAHVTFTATLTRGGADASFTERSRFVRRDGRWLYHSGEPG